MQSFLEEVAHDILAKKGAKLHHCSILFNNKRPADYLKKHLATQIQKPFWSPKFYTIQEFIAESNGYQIADPHTQLFVLYDAYVDILKLESANFIPSISQFQSIGQIILGDFAQIDMELVQAEQLFLALEDIATINERFDFLSEDQKVFLNQFWSAYDAGKHQKMQQNFIAMWQRMPKLYNLFFSKLAEMRLSTSAKMYRNLAEHDDFGDDFAQDSLVFVGFNALSKAEVKIFSKLQEKGKALFYFDTDSYYLEDDLQEAGFFVRKNIQQFGLLNQLSNDGSFIKAMKRTMEVYKIQGDTAQAKVVAKVVKPYLSKLKDETTSNTAIILANESLLFPVLQSIPELYNGQEIPLNVTMGMAFKSSSLYGLVEMWLETQINYRRQGNAPIKVIHYKLIQAFASHPLIGISEKLREKLLAGLVKAQSVEVSTDKVIQFGGLALQFFKPVLEVRDYVQGLMDLFENILARELANKTLTAMASNLFIGALKELNRLQDNLRKHLVRYADAEIDVSFVSSLILKSLQNVAVPLTGEATQGLQVMGLLESRSLNFKNLFVLGANEGVMPKGSASASFIPESLRMAYGLPILAYQDAISAYMFYRLVQRAENIHVFYNAHTDEKSTGERSRFISQLAYESGFDVVEKELQLSVITEPKSLISIEKDEAIMKALGNYLGLNKALSASAFTTYLQNPIDFFLAHIAKLEEPKVVMEQVEAFMVGKILHTTMERFYQILIQQDNTITSEKINGLMPELDTLIKNSAVFELYHIDDSSLKLKGLQKVVVAIVRKYVDLILKEDLKKTPFQIEKLEHRDYYVHSFEDSDGVERKIKLMGIFDRIDHKDGVYTIIDYKTGSDDLSFSTIDENFDAEVNSINKALIQTLFYAYIYEKSTAKSHVQVNLYVLKKMKNGDVMFESKHQGKLTADHLEQVKEGFVLNLNRSLASLFNPNLPFKPSSKPKNYIYSIYKDIFGGE